jgi:hypothetical protein
MILKSFKIKDFFNFFSEKQKKESTGSTANIETTSESEQLIDYLRV